MPTRSPRAPSSFYSYSAKRNLRQEEVAAYRRIALATVIIVALLVGGYFLGIPLLAQLGAGSTPITTHTPLGTTDNIPPTAPRLDSLPDVTKTKTLSLSGSAESGSTVSIKVNDKELLSTLVDKGGSFKGDITLSGGDNTITATAKDPVGNVSRASKAIIVTYDAAPPKLLINSPVTDPTITTSNAIVISGKTDTTATITINDRQAIVQQDGSFNLSISLNAGDNVILTIATDAAGNMAKISKTVTYTAPDQATSSATPQ
jgi:hypothetical protein